MDKKQGLTILLTVIITLLIVCTILLLTGVINFKGKEKNNEEIPQGSTETETVTNEDYNIILTEQEKTYDYGDLHLEFKHIELRYEGEHDYILKIKLGDTEIDNSIFSDNDNITVRSTTEERSHFFIYKRDKVYVLVSNQTFRQCLNDTVMILNTEGTILKTAKHSTFQIFDKNISIEVSDDGTCRLGPPEEIAQHITEESFTILGSNII